MIKNIKKKALMMLLLLNLLAVSEGTVYAGEHQISLELTVKQTIQCKNGEAEQIKKTGTYELTSLTPDAPMPEGSERNVYSFSMEGADVVAKIPLVYTSGGVYQYQLIQTTEEQEDYTYDKTNYKITVYIRNTEEDGFVSEVVAEDNSGRKYGELKFQNSYQGKNGEGSETANTVQTGDQTTTGMWIIFMVLSITVFLFGRNKRKNIL